MRKTLDVILGVQSDGEILVAEEYSYYDGEDGHAKGQYLSLFTMRYMDPDTVEDLNSDERKQDYYCELWKDAVRSDRTYLGLDDWIDEVDSYEDGPYPGYDESFQGDFERAMALLDSEQEEKLKYALGAEDDEDFITECGSCGQVDIPKRDEFELCLVDNEVLKALQDYRDSRISPDKLDQVIKEYVKGESSDL